MGQTQNTKSIQKRIYGIEPSSFPRTFARTTKNSEIISERRTNNDDWGEGGCLKEKNQGAK